MSSPPMLLHVDMIYLTKESKRDVEKKLNNVYFDNMVSQIYPSELQLNQANTFDTKTAF